MSRGRLCSWFWSQNPWDSQRTAVGGGEGVDVGLHVCPRRPDLSMKPLHRRDEEDTTGFQHRALRSLRNLSTQPGLPDCCVWVGRQNIFYSKVCQLNSELKYLNSWCLVSTFASVSEGPQMLAKLLDSGAGAGRGSQVPCLPPAMPAAPACQCLSAGQQPQSHLSALMSPSCHSLSSPR